MKISIKIILLVMQSFMLIASESLKLPEHVEPLHSNIHLKRIENKSSRNIFVAFERTHIMGESITSEPINLSGHVMPGSTFEIKGPKVFSHGIMVPVWQKTFRGNTINVVSLSGHPGMIYYLYVIKDDLWAIKAPQKQGELKGVHLLKGSDQEQNVELEVHNNNVLKVHVLNEQGERIGESTKLNGSADHTLLPEQVVDESDEYIPEEKQIKRYAR